MANKYFGKEDPIGKVVTLGQDEQLKVTGVIPTTLQNSSFKYRIMMPYRGLTTWLTSKTKKATITKPSSHRWMPIGACLVSKLTCC
jgi:putative ABC transport system permease protein